MVAPHDRSSYETWPASALPARLLRAWPRARVRDDGWVVGPELGSQAARGRAEAQRRFNPEHNQSGDLGVRDLGAVRLTAPPELHLREFRDADIRDADSLVKLVQLVGFPLDPTHPERGVTDREEPVEQARHFYALAVTKVAESLPFEGPPGLEARPSGEAAHLAEVAYRVRCVRAMVDHTDAVQRGQSVEKAWQAGGWFDFPDLVYRTAPDLADRHPTDLAWDLFAELLNDGLAAVSPRMSRPGEAAPVVDAYTAACAAIFSDLADKMPYRRCADPTCRRLFKNQLGRGSVGPSRKDVAYCTHQHAKNHAQRQARAAKRAARDERKSQP